MPFASTLHTAVGTADESVVGIDTRRWCSLAIGSLVIAGLLSLAVVVGRLPVLSRIIDDPLFFKRCLVVHVDLALVVWFYAFLAGLTGLRISPIATWIRTAAYTLAVAGVLTMLLGALVRGAEPILANYVPVIDHPLFHAGLAAFFAGTLVHFLGAALAPATKSTGGLPDDALLGLRAGAVTTVIAAATWIAARTGIPGGLDVTTRAEFLAWGPGHVLQAANACAMISVWFWMLSRATGTPVLSQRVSRTLFAILVLPQAAMPLLTARGTMDTLYYSGATQLMRWSIFPAVLAALVAGIIHLKRHRQSVEIAAPATRVALTGLAASSFLAVGGMILGASIRGSTTLIPAHYHASLGAVTVAFMAAAYCVSDMIRPGLDVRTWRAAKRQLTLFGVGQSIFVIGFAIGGAYGLGRKTYATDQHIRTGGEFLGLGVMGLGGIVAVSGGLWFLFLLLREIRGWWRPGAAPRTELHAPALS